MAERHSSVLFILMVAAALKEVSAAGRFLTLQPDGLCTSSVEHRSTASSIKACFPRCLNMERTCLGLSYNSDTNECEISSSPETFVCNDGNRKTYVYEGTITTLPPTEVPATEATTTGAQEAHTPTTAVQAPTIAGQGPATVVQAQTTVVQTPTTVAQAPTTVAQAPTTVALLQTTAAQVPTTAAQAPTTVAQLPTTAAPAPVTTIPTPSYPMLQIMEVEDLRSGNSAAGFNLRDGLCVNGIFTDEGCKVDDSDTLLRVRLDNKFDVYEIIIYWPAPIANHADEISDIEIRISDVNARLDDPESVFATRLGPPMQNPEIFTCQQTGEIALNGDKVAIRNIGGTTNLLWVFEIEFYGI